MSRASTWKAKKQRNFNRVVDALLHKVANGKGRRVAALLFGVGDLGSDVVCGDEGIRMGPDQVHAINPQEVDQDGCVRNDNRWRQTIILNQ